MLHDNHVQYRIKNLSNEDVDLKLFRNGSNNAFDTETRYVGKGKEDYTGITPNNYLSVNKVRLGYNTGSGNNGWIDKDVISNGDVITPDFTASFFLDRNNGWLGDADGNVYITSDGGDNWSSPIEMATSSRILKIIFTSSLIGYAIADTGTFEVYKTTDGGITWNYVLSEGTGICYDISAYDDNNIIAVGVVDSSDYDGDAYVTMDGFGTFHDISSAFDGFCPNGLFRCAYINSTNCFVFSKNYDAWFKIANDDALGTWTTHSSGVILDTDTNNCSFVDENIGYVTCNTDKVYKTTDGLNWSNIYTLPNVIFSGDIHFIDADNGMVVGTGSSTNGNVYITSDGGDNWSLSRDNAVFQKMWAFSLSMIDTTRAYLFGAEGKYSKYDIGSGYTELTIPSYMDLGSSELIDYLNTNITGVQTTFPKSNGESLDIDFFSKEDKYNYDGSKVMYSIYDIIGNTNYDYVANGIYLTLYRSANSPTLPEYNQVFLNDTVETSKLYPNIEIVCNNGSVSARESVEMACQLNSVITHFCVDTDNLQQLTQGVGLYYVNYKRFKGKRFNVLHNPTYYSFLYRTDDFPQDFIMDGQNYISYIIKANKEILLTLQYNYGLTLFSGYNLSDNYIKLVNTYIKNYKINKIINEELKQNEQSKNK